MKSVKEIFHFGKSEKSTSPADAPDGTCRLSARSILKEPGSSRIREGEQTEYGPAQNQTTVRQSQAKLELLEYLQDLSDWDSSSISSQDDVPEEQRLDSESELEDEKLDQDERIQEREQTEYGPAQNQRTVRQSQADSTLVQSLKDQPHRDSSSISSQDDVPEEQRLDSESELEDEKLDQDERIQEREQTEYGPAQNQRTDRQPQTDSTRVEYLQDLSDSDSSSISSQYDVPQDQRLDSDSELEDINSLCTKEDNVMVHKDEMSSVKVEMEDTQRSDGDWDKERNDQGESLETQTLEDCDSGSTTRDHTVPEVQQEPSPVMDEFLETSEPQMDKAVTWDSDRSPKIQKKRRRLTRTQRNSLYVRKGSVQDRYLSDSDLEDETGPQNASFPALPRASPSCKAPLLNINSDWHPLKSPQTNEMSKVSEDGEYIDTDDSVQETEQAECGPTEDQSDEQGLELRPSDNLEDLSDLDSESISSEQGNFEDQCVESESGSDEHKSDQDERVQETEQTDWEKPQDQVDGSDQTTDGQPEEELSLLEYLQGLTESDSDCTSRTEDVPEDLHLDSVSEPEEEKSATDECLQETEQTKDLVDGSDQTTDSQPEEHLEDLLDRDSENVDDLVETTHCEARTEQEEEDKRDLDESLLESEMTKSEPVLNKPGHVQEQQETQKDDSDGDLLEHTFTLQEQIRILRGDLEHTQASSNLKEMMNLQEENEALKEQLEDAQREAKAHSDALIQTVFSCRQQLAALKSELDSTKTHLATAVQEAERCSAEKADAEKALLREKEESQRLKDRLIADSAIHRDAVSSLSLKLSKAKSEGDRLKNELHRVTLQLTEKGLLLDVVQKEKEQLAAQVESLNKALQAQKEVLSKTEASHEVMKLRVTLADERNKELASQTVTLQNQVCRSQEEKSQTNETVRQLQQELIHAQSRQSHSEASLEVNTRRHSALEEDNARVRKDLERLREKLSQSEDQNEQAEKRFHSLKSSWNEKEQELSSSNQRLQEALSDAASSATTIKRLTKVVQKLQLRNSRLKEDFEEQLKRETSKSHELQKETRRAQKKAKEMSEQKHILDDRLEQEMKRNAEVHQEMSRLTALIKKVKKRLQDQHLEMEQKHQDKLLELRQQLELSQREQAQAEERTRQERHKLEQRIQELETKASRSRTSLQDSLSQQKSLGMELDRYKKLYSEELRQHQSVASKLDKTNTQLTDTYSQLVHERRRSSLGLNQSQGLSQFRPVSTRPSISVEDFHSRMKYDLDRAMSRELSKIPTGTY